MIKDIPLEVTAEATLMPFLISTLADRSRDNIKSLLRNRQILVNGEPVTQFNHELKPGDTILVSSNRHTGGLMARNMRLVYEDEHLIVIDKNAGILSIASDHEKYLTAYNILSTYVKSQKPSNRILLPVVVSSVVNEWTLNAALSTSRQLP